MTKFTELKINFNNAVEEHPFILGIPCGFLMVLGIMVYIGLFIWGCIMCWNIVFPYSTVFH